MMLNLSGEQTCALLHAIAHYTGTTLHAEALAEIRTKIEKAQAK